MLSSLDWFIEEGNLYVRYCTIVPLLIGGIRFRHLSFAQRLLVATVLMGIVAEVASLLVMELEDWTNNMPVFHLYVVGEYCLLTSIFFFGKKGLLSALHYRILMGGFLLFAGLSAIFFQGIWEVNSLVRSLESILLIFLALWYFHQTLQRLDTPNLAGSFSFWFATAVLLYFVANLLLFIYSSSIIEERWESETDPSIFQVVWSMFNFMNLLLYLLYTIALLCKEPLPSLKSS